MQIYSWLSYKEQVRLNVWYLNFYEKVLEQNMSLVQQEANYYLQPAKRW